MRNILTRFVLLLLIASCYQSGSAGTLENKVTQKNVNNISNKIGKRSVIWEQNFDSQIPGQKPGKWYRAWGTKDDDQLLVSNLHAISGRNSLLLDRKTGLNLHMWGAALGFPDVSSPKFVLSFSFLIEGTGNEACFSFEIRGANANTDRIATVAIRNLNVYLATSKAVKRKKKSVLLGRYEPGQWYRIELILSTSGTQDLKALGSLYSFQKGSILTKDRSQSVEIDLPKKKYGILMLNVAPNKRNYRLFIDDIVIRKK